MNRIPPSFSRAVSLFHEWPAAMKIFFIFVAMAIALWVSVALLAIKCVFIVESHLLSQKWSLPATVYAKAPVLQPGVRWNPRRLSDYFDGLNYEKHRSDDSILAEGEYRISGHEILFRKRSLAGEKDPQEIRVFFDDGRVVRLRDDQSEQDINSYELEPAPIQNLFGDEWEKRTLIRLDDIPSDLIHAVIAIEDRRFYEHHGIDFRAILRAFWKNMMLGRISEGGSTITQQVAKNFYLSPERSIQRKASELLMALVLESKLNKSQILELYLNEIYLGQQGSIAIHGVQEASRFYFHKDVQHITTAEAALLAGMIKAPSLYNPIRHQKEVKQRRELVLDAMRQMDFLTEAQSKNYASLPIKVFPPDIRINLAPYFGDLVKAQLLQKYGEKKTYTADLHIYTSLDLDMQEEAEKALITGLKEIDRLRIKETGKHVQGCLIAVDPRTGYVRALVGGRNYSESQFNRVTQAFRQMGSVFKPVVYAAALEGYFYNQKIYTPATLVEDEPWSFKDSRENWEPANYDGQFHGPVTLRTALAHSLNVATARLAVDVGLNRVASLARRMGFENAGSFPSLALGTVEASPWQVAKAYTVFANHGLETELQTVSKMTDASGKILEQEKTPGKQILHRQTAFLITDMLRSAVINGTGAPLNNYGFVTPVAGKTGTTDEYRDAWFVGYTPQLLCLVWVGYDDNTTAGMTGAQAALPIWAHFMMRATQDLPSEDFDVPPGIVRATIDPVSGKLATPACPQAIPETFIEGTEPVDFCTHDWSQPPWFGPDETIGWKYHFRQPDRSRPPVRGVWWHSVKRRLHSLFH